MEPPPGTHDPPPVRERRPGVYGPHLSREDVQACIACGAEMARERCVELPLRPSA